METQKRSNWRGVLLLVVMALTMTLAPFLAVSPAQLAAADDEPQVIALAELRVTGPALDDIGKQGAWDCGANWIVGNRWGDTTADNDALGGSLPPGGYVAKISAFTNNGRYYRLTLYAPQNPEQGRRGGDLIIEFPYDLIQREGGYQFPTGRFDPVGKPNLYYTPNQLRFDTALFRGGGPTTDGGRVYTGCGIIGQPNGG